MESLWKPIVFFVNSELSREAENNFIWSDLTEFTVYKFLFNFSLETLSSE